MRKTSLFVVLAYTPAFGYNFNVNEDLHPGEILPAAGRQAIDGIYRGKPEIP